MGKGPCLAGVNLCRLPCLMEQEVGPARGARGPGRRGGRLPASQLLPPVPKTLPFIPQHPGSCGFQYVSKNVQEKLMLHGSGCPTDVRVSAGQVAERGRALLWLHGVVAPSSPALPVGPGTRAGTFSKLIVGKRM